MIIVIGMAYGFLVLACAGALAIEGSFVHALKGLEVEMIPLGGA